MVLRPFEGLRAGNPNRFPYFHSGLSNRLFPTEHERALGWISARFPWTQTWGKIRLQRAGENEERKETQRSNPPEAKSTTPIDEKCGKERAKVRSLSVQALVEAVVRLVGGESLYTAPLQSCTRLKCRVIVFM